MSETLSIKERIEIQLATDIQAVTGIGTIYRYDARGLHVLNYLDGFIDAQNETASESIVGNPGPRTKTLGVDIGILLMIPDTTDLCDSFVHNRWIALIEDKLMDNRYLAEPTGGPQLSHVGLNIVGTRIEPDMQNPPGLYSIVEIEIPYMHDGNSPYTLGTLITAKVVTDLPEWCTNQLS